MFFQVLVPEISYCLFCKKSRFVVCHTFEDLEGQRKEYVDVSRDLKLLEVPKEKAFVFDSLKIAKLYIRILTADDSGFSWDGEFSYSKIKNWYLRGMEIEAYTIERLPWLP